MVAATEDVLQFKEIGNGLFKKAEYQLAITEYSKGSLFTPFHPNL